MINQSAEYALRTTLFMANQGCAGGLKAGAIADALGVPSNYLSKVMLALVRAGVLRSGRGPTGGYSLARAATELKLIDVIAPFQQLNHHARCLLGDRACDPAQPCAAHLRWAPVKAHFNDFIHSTTVADLITSPPPVADTPNLTEVV
jgi:Rrf2 family transcriptional regulator, iron-sulfur cluster assembly transcription factor